MKKLKMNKNTNEVRRAGVEALIKDLEILGTVNFLRKFDMGHGDYTKERVNNKSVMDIVNEIQSRKI
jgi:hypothetical protein